MLQTLGAYRSREANTILVDYLRAALEDNRPNTDLLNAVHALEEGTGQHWMQAGAQPEDVRRQEARTAVQWWDAGGKLQGPPPDRIVPGRAP